MFIALYRWKVKAGQEQIFQEGWRRRTEEIYRHCGSLGSRLHQAEDGTWLGYAQWPDRQTYDAARSVPVVDVEAGTMMRESIEESYPDIYMNVVDDLFKTERYGQEE